MIKLTENQREILQAVLDGKDIRSTDIYSRFYDVTTYEEFIVNAFYSRRIEVKPRTITVNGIEVPEPMKVRPEEGTLYYTSSTNPEQFLKWRGDNFDETCFNDGICHSTPEAATLHWEAMIAPSKIKN